MPIGRRAELEADPASREGRPPVRCEGEAMMAGKRRVMLGVAVVAAVAMVAAACGGEEGGAPSGTAGAGKDVVRAAFVYIGPPGDGGWTYQHEQGRLYLQDQLGDKVVTTKVESVPETPSDATRVIRQLAQKNDIVFTTSFGYMDPTLTVAGEFPNVYFEHCSGYKSADNMGNYFGAMEEARYLSGMVAGSVTKSNVLGYVAAFPIPEVVRGINAFTLGVRAVNPKAVVKVVWTSTWYDPAKERAAAESLLDAGADVLAQHEVSPATGEAAEARGAHWVGYDSDMRRFAPKAFLTAPVWNWGPYYVSRVQAILDGTWEPDSYYGNMADGMIEIAPMSDLVPADVQDAVTQRMADIKSGAFHALQGPIYDQQGTLKIPEGEVMSLKDALAWQWFVQGVEGKIPS
jgi:basic membrane protein A